MTNQPIPQFEFPNDIQYVKYNDNKDESLVSISEYFLGKVIVNPIYYNQNLVGTENDCKVRYSVAERLEKALNYLPKGITFKVFDGFRSFETQQALYNQYYETLKNRHSKWSKNILEKEVKKFVSKPSYDINKPFVHNTGGAIDLTLFDINNNIDLDMGTNFDDFSEKANTCYFETNLVNEEIRNNRRLLYWTMINSGFTNLPTEWWHYDYGDAFWGFYTNNSAIFCGILYN